MGKGIVTINTDAACHHQKGVGSYAYWIKSDDLFLKGSGIFKDKCKGSTDAEFQAIINALFILKSSSIPEIHLIIFNRDNINTGSKKKGNKYQKMIYYMLKEIYQSKCSWAKKYPHRFTKFYEFRHVKAHSETTDKRSYVNKWCDNECKKQIREWRKNHSPAPAADAVVKS